MEPYLIKVVISKYRYQNPDYPEDEKCACGHPYGRHFDGYEDIEFQDAGCKYCSCSTFSQTEETLLAPAVKFIFNSRGFITFGETGVRESSSAETPCAWYHDDEQLCLDDMEEIADTGDIGAQAFIAYVETCPGPRWFDYEQPDKKVASTGPPPWFDHDEIPIGEVIKNRYGWVIWVGDPEADSKFSKAFAATPKAGQKYLVEMGADPEKVIAYDRDTKNEFLEGY